MKSDCPIVFSHNNVSSTDLVETVETYLVLDHRKMLQDRIAALIRYLEVLKSMYEQGLRNRIGDYHRRNWYM